MVSNRFFEQNLELFARAKPQLAIKLPYIEVDDTLLPEDSAEKARKRFKGLDLEDKKVIYAFGVGQGHFYNAVSRWLKKDPKRSLVFFENRLDVLRNLLGTKLGNEILRDEQVRLHYLTDIQHDDELFNWICWDYLKQPFVVTALEDYKRNQSDVYTQLQDRLVYDHHRREEIVEEYLDHGIIFYQNFYANLLHLHESSLGNALFSKFKNVPAIICGAGPSLQKNIHLLKELGDRALILAGGSAINALTNAGVLPHFGCGIDPNYDQYRRLIGQKAFEVPFFYRQRMHHDAFRTIHGPRLYVTGTGGYETARYFDEKLGIHEEFLDEGHNVVNFCTSIAHALGCNPIIFVGLDLAFTDMQLYAKGVMKSAKVDEARILEEDGINHAAIVRKDIYGKPIYTLWKWIAEAEWTSEFANEHPDVTLINATEGGLGIDGIVNETLSEVTKKHLKKQYDLSSLVWTEVQNAALPRKTKRIVLEALDELRSSLERCQGHADVLLKEIAALRRKAKGGALQSGRMALAQMELEEEIAYPYVLEIFNGLVEHMVSKDLKGIEANRSNRPASDLVLERLEIEKRRYAFLRRTAKVNVQLIDYALQNPSKAL